jgi:hypothetical protein
MLANVPTLVSLGRGLGVSSYATEGGDEMHDAAMRRRIAALVIAALLAISGAALTSAYFAADDQAAIKGITEFEV